MSITFRTLPQNAFKWLKPTKEIWDVSTKIIQNFICFICLRRSSAQLSTPQSNQELSDKRCKSVKARVAAYASQVNFKIEQAKGESESMGDDYDDDGYWWAIEIYVFSSKPPPQKFKPVLQDAAVSYVSIEREWEYNKKDSRTIWRVSLRKGVTEGAVEYANDGSEIRADKNGEVIFREKSKWEI